MFSIGEFSKITGISVRTLRFYHEKEILVPAAVDAATGYRSYDQRNVERARTIAALRDLEFSLEQIRKILDQCRDDADILDALEHQKHKLADDLNHLQGVVRQIDGVLFAERQAREDAKMSAQSLEIQERDLPDLLVAGVRMKGKYSECGTGFAKLGKLVGRYASGKPFCLYYDGEYREDDADLETCFPLRKQVQADGVDVRELPGGRAVTLVHQGPYQQLGRSYERVLEYVHQRNYEVELPTREVYLKGPGMIFKGNPQKYVTEIQMIVASPPSV